MMPRDDLPYLRRRVRQGSRAAQAPQVPRPVGAPDTALDLSASAFVAHTPASVRHTVAAPPRRTSTGAVTRLTDRSPVVSLTRMQAGIGALTVEAVWPEKDQLRIGCVFRTNDGLTAIAALEGEAGPVDPVLTSIRGARQSVRLDLLRARTLDRAVIFAVLYPPLPSGWHSALAISMAGAARIEVPVEHPGDFGIAVPLSLYRVGGELVVRAEQEVVRGTLRDACTAFGFDQLSWANPYTPLSS